MEESIFDEVKRYIRFGEEDEKRLRELAPLLRPRFRAVVEVFYQRIEEHAGARAVLREGEAQVVRLKGTLERWLTQAFEGPWDQAYYEERARVGRKHVAIGLPQHYNFAAMDVIRQELVRAILGLESNAERRHAALVSVDKLLDLELAIILHTYSEDYMVQLRRKERLATFGLLTSTIGHELRNPLGVIASSAYLLRQSLGEEDRALRHLDKIQDQAARGNRIITSLLEIMRDRQTTATPVAPAALAERGATAVCEARGVAVELRIEDGLPSVWVDVDQMHQVLINLLSNAVDAAGRDGRVRLSAYRRKEQVVFEIDDNGPGVESGILPRLFEPLVTTKPEGIGLGLALCKKLVEANGATLEVGRSAELGGARFLLGLPLVG